jgi:hypothetical protein
MLSIEFRSRDPFDHICRALDMGRRTGLVLVRLNAAGTGTEGFLVEIAFAGGPPETGETLVRRLAALRGVDGLVSSVRREA